MVAASLVGNASRDKVDDMSSTDSEWPETFNITNPMTVAIVILALAILFSLAWRDPFKGPDNPA
jgi:hypothetical protein